jgi:hypothetical protein
MNVGITVITSRHVNESLSLQQFNNLQFARLNMHGLHEMCLCTSPRKSVTCVGSVASKWPSTSEQTRMWISRGRLRRAGKTMYEHDSQLIVTLVTSDARL